MTDARIEAAAKAIYLWFIGSDDAAKLWDRKDQDDRDYFISHVAAPILAASDAALDWDALTAKLYARGFDLREQGLILADIRAWLGLP